MQTHIIKSDALEVGVLDYGGRIVMLKSLDRGGVRGDIVLGYEHVDEYRTDTHYFGALIGRYANRIASGRFELGGREYRITTHNDGNALHGGSGFHSKHWSVERIADGLELSYVSPDGEDGFPGELRTHVRYTLRSNELRIDYEARSDRDTIVNFTSHPYFNLRGSAERDVLDHELTLFADQFTPTTAAQIPTGELRDVRDTPFDFRTPRRIGDRIDATDEQLRFAHGYDHNWVLRARTQQEPTLAARVYEPTSGRVLELLTTEPGIQFYAGNLLNGVRGKDGKSYRARDGLCLEPQHFPDSPNQPHFPTTVLAAGKRFRSSSIYRFSTQS